MSLLSAGRSRRRRRRRRHHRDCPRAAARPALRTSPPGPRGSPCRTRTTAARPRRRRRGLRAPRCPSASGPTAASGPAPSRPRASKPPSRAGARAGAPDAPPEEGSPRFIPGASETLMTRDVTSRHVISRATDVSCTTTPPVSHLVLCTVAGTFAGCETAMACDCNPLKWHTPVWPVSNTRFASFWTQTLRVSRPLPVEIGGSGPPGPWTETDCVVECGSRACLATGRTELGRRCSVQPELRRPAERDAAR